MADVLLPLLGPNGDKRGEYVFWCPGCECAHSVDGRWTVTGTMEKPTIRASILVKAPGPRCHSFVTDGEIKFLGDCEHALAGKTVALAIPDHWGDDDG